MHHLLSYPQLLTVKYFHKKSSIIDVRLSFKNTSLLNYHSVLTLKSMFSFELLCFGFSLKETLTLLTVLVKQYTAKRKIISENNITDTVKRTRSKERSHEK